MSESLLLGLVSGTNFVSLTVSLWLGFYIVTRSPGSRTSWLAAATLWSLSGYFLNNLTYIQHPPGEGTLPWWWGWSVAFAVPFWFHLSVSLLPGGPARLRRLLTIVVYLLALNLVAMEAYTPWIFAGATMARPVLNSAQRAGAYFPLFALFVVGVPALSLYHLHLCWRQARSAALRRQLTALQWATLLAISSGTYTSVSIALGLDTPTIVGHLVLGAGVALLGYGIARYSALIEGRAARLDFTYTALAAGLVVAAYLLAAFISDVVFDVPLIAFVFITMLAVVSHSLYDAARTYLDRLFYRQRYRELRANLRELARTTVPGQDLRDHLQAIVETLCGSLGAAWGTVALREGEEFVFAANWKMGTEDRWIASADLTADEITVLSRAVATRRPLDEIQDGGGRGPGPGASTGLVVPLHAGGQQIGAVVLGPRVTGAVYGDEDLDLLDDLADRVAAVVHTVRLQEQGVQEMSALLRELRKRERELQARMRQVLAAEAGHASLEGRDEEETVSQVEDSLRHLYDYPYLGGHALAGLRIVRLRLDVPENGFVTHLDRGRALQRVLVAALEKLRPAGPRPSQPTREWHQYVVLHDCYVEGKPNREVTSALYIGEGTFNRTRRRAIRAVARALAEMEEEARRRVAG
jgi:GAF domain-containing protein